MALVENKKRPVRWSLFSALPSSVGRSVVAAPPHTTAPPAARRRFPVTRPPALYDLAGAASP